MQIPQRLSRLLTKQAFLPLLILAVGIGVTELGTWQERSRIAGQQRQQALTSAAAIRAALESELNANLNLASGLAAYLRNTPGTPTQIQAMLEDLYEQGRYLRNFAVAPDNRIAYVYPVEGNKAALGLDYRSIPSQWPAVAHIMETRQPFLAGPVPLVQGGVGLIYRRPVFLSDGSYWGLISSVIDMDHLFDSVLSPFLAKGAALAIRGKDGRGELGEVFHGNAELFKQPEAVLMDISTPGGHWQLAVMPPPPAGLTRHLLLLHAAGYGATLLLTLLVMQAIHANAQRRRLAEKVRRLYELSPLGIAMTDVTGRFQEFNQAFCRLTGYSEDELRGRGYWELTPPEYSEADKNRIATLHKTGRYGPHEKEYVRADGTRVPIRLNGVLVTGEDGNKTIWSIVEDISEHKASEARIHTLAFYDDLTGLPNRRLLLDRLSHALAARDKSVGALLFIDLDNFKTLNDTRGHAVGDLLLKAVAEQIVSCVRAGDTVGRLGGDEFVVILEGLGHDEIQASTAVEVVGEKIRDHINRPFALEGEPGTHHGSASIGISLFRSHEASVEALLRQADVALYQAKDAGRNAIRFYNTATQAAVDARAVIETGLRQALERSEFQLYYQPQIDTERGLVGAEALLRWRPSDGNMVTPDRFIPIAEETGLIIPIGQWVLDQACAQIARWQADPATAHLQLAVNVSPRQFRQEDFVSDIKQTLAHHQALPHGLKLELTEGLVLDDVEAAIQKMQALRVFGVSFSLDDFGTGYSSLSYLRRLPFDQLKIDRSFVNDIESEGDNAAIILAIISMSHSLHLQVIAEGVETEGQQAFLTEHGCETFQGFLFGRPMPEADFDAFLSQKLAATQVA
ncbi:MAG TPA: EAL domain-containing protein [Rhodocyclaceae bacterium]|nr:EAL domain-containing protein [Rhodocyclaceae bacterium]